jgi:hypothetical protein
MVKLEEEARLRGGANYLEHTWAGFVSIASMGPGDLNTRPMDSMSPKPARF